MLAHTRYGERYRVPRYGEREREEGHVPRPVPGTHAVSSLSLHPSLSLSLSLSLPPSLPLALPLSRSLSLALPLSLSLSLSLTHTHTHTRDACRDADIGGRIKACACHQRERCEEEKRGSKGREKEEVSGGRKPPLGVLLSSRRPPLTSPALPLTSPASSSPPRPCLQRGRFRREKRREAGREI